MALSKEQIENLKVGQTLKLSTNFPKHDSHLVAKVVVLSLGRVACWVRVIEILDRGPENLSKDGYEYAAMFAELEVIPE